MSVSRTAVMTAALRATETARPDRLFTDPLASAFVAAAREPVVQLPPGASEFAAIRTRFFDDEALAAGAAGIRQVVLLAAGFDTRAFRLPWPAGVRLFELDLPETFAVKEPVLRDGGAVPRAVRTVVPVDLRADWSGALDAAGFVATEPTGWLAEGLLPYLDGADRDRLLALVTAGSADGSRFAFDQLGGEADHTAGVRATVGAIRAAGAPVGSTMDSPVDWLAGHGWRAAVSRIPALGEFYRRPLPEYVDLAASNATALVSARR
jgi:methyltransferase (TIGR00027 family)